MYNKRMNQLIFMFSEVTGKTTEEAEQIISSTYIGQSIKENNPAILYEQQTENLYSLVEELRKRGEYQDIVKLFSCEAIVNAMKKLEKREKQLLQEANLQYRSAPILKEKRKKQEKMDMKNMMKVKSQNQINVGRM